MSKPTLVFIRAHHVNGRLSHYPGEEVPTGLLSQEIIDPWTRPRRAERIRRRGATEPLSFVPPLHRQQNKSN